MHEYSIDKEIRKKTAITLFILSSLISVLLEGLFGKYFAKLLLQVEQNETFANLLNLLEIWEFPNLIGFGVTYGFVSIIYEKLIWKCKLLQVIHGLPNLNGHWEGTLLSSYTSDPIPMEMDITQTWSKISFKSTFPKTRSCSYSNTAAIQINDSEGISIYFGFRNQSNDISSKLQTYYGYNILKLENKETHISAIYFNNRPSSRKGQGGNMGTFELDRIKKKAEK